MKNYYEFVDGKICDRINKRYDEVFSVLPEGITKHDISTEKWREYVYDDETSYYIENPKTLYINHKSEVISHRVVDNEGVTHYPCPSWIALRWKADPEVSF